MSAWRPASRVFFPVLLVAMFASAGPSDAHPLAPALLELSEDGSGRVDVTWKRSSIRPRAGVVEPVLPPGCPSVGAPHIETREGATLLRWTVDCGRDGLVGRNLRVDGTERARVDTLVRIELADGRRIQRILRSGDDTMVVPARATRMAVFFDYLSMGFAHILGGADHLLFVFGLHLLCATTRSLVATITSFTVGHSLTLSLAAFGVTDWPAGPIEVLIAASVLWLAVELAREPAKPTLMRRHPWPMGLGFGLLHGLGFAGALRAVGLPAGEIPTALLAFNVGIEIGQLAFVGLVVALAPLAARLPVRWPTRAAIYAMGSLAAFWVFDRGLAVL